MADFAQILLLPAPQPPLQRPPARENELAVPAETLGGGDTARARRFRFRVHEGDEGSATNTDLATRRTDSRTTLNNGGSAEDATGQSSSRRIRYASTGDSRSGNSSAFLAQAFAQEQLGEGLHNPPFAAAASAYSRAGAALNAPASAGIDIRA
jgi:hypothetical protein